MLDLLFVCADHCVLYQHFMCCVYICVYIWVYIFCDYDPPQNTLRCQNGAARLAVLQVTRQLLTGPFALSGTGSLVAGASPLLAVMELCTHPYGTCTQPTLCKVLKPRKALNSLEQVINPPRTITLAS